MSIIDTDNDYVSPDGQPTRDVPTDQKGQPILPPSKMTAAGRFKVLQRWMRADADRSGPWRIRAREDFRFRAGDQWDDTDKEILREQKRPIIVFNRALTILKAVAGMEINGRHEIEFLPQNNEDTLPNELLSAASKWMAAGCDAEDEESEAFDNCATCGMGWTESRLNYEDDPMGMYLEESINPLEMYWDYTCTKKNLTGARRIARAKRMPLSEAMQMFPGKTAYQLDASGWVEGLESKYSVKSIEEKRRRTEENSDFTEDYDDTNEIVVVHMQWIEKEVYWIVADPLTNTKSELSDEQYERLRARFNKFGIPLTAVRMTRKRYKQAFLGNEELQFGDAPCQTRFIWQCITGELDRECGHFFGLIKVMRDPQMWANKWLSQTLHILNTTAKGGIIAEVDAFDDIREAEQKWAQPDAIVWASPNAIAGGKGKIMPKPGEGMAAGHIQLMQFAITAIRDCTGINLELLGQQDQNQPGILEAQRKQAGMTVLATLFDSLRRFRKNVGHIRLYYIQNYFSDGRLIRVAGPLAVKALPLLRDKTFGKYDVIIDDAPTSPNQKEANWAVIAPMLAMFKEQLASKPQILAAILEYSPLPSQLVELVKQLINEDINNPETKRKAAEMEALAKAQITAEVNKDQSTAELNLAKAGATQAQSTLHLAQAQALMAEGRFEELRAHLGVMEAAQKARKADADVAIAQTKAEGQRHETTARMHEADANLENARLDHAARLADLQNETRATDATITKDYANADAQASKAFRDRVGALVEALQPVETDETKNRPPPKPKASGK